ncbi:MAG TPA: hypothetical protein VFQ61_24090, partial [Polyangiaceae bacterium]|nr:hypothetical protein [Polyangiaceae bacterium]
AWRERAMAQHNLHLPGSDVASPIAPSGALSAERLEVLASGQKLLIYAILLNIATYALSRAMGPIVGLLAFPSVVLSVIGVYRIARGLGWSSTLGVVLAALTLVPFVALVVLIVLNGRASRRLRDGGYRVGLLGASRV